MKSTPTQSVLWEKKSTSFPEGPSHYVDNGRGKRRKSISNKYRFLDTNLFSFLATNNFYIFIALQVIIYDPVFLFILTVELNRGNS